VVPTIDVFSGGVERTTRLIEFSQETNVRYLAYLPAGGVPNPDARRRLEELERRGLVELRASSGRTPNGSDHDLVAVPTEYWWPGYRRARGIGLRGPYCFDFHQLPYVGTLDILKSAAIHDPGLADLAWIPILQRQRYADGLFLSAFQTLASVTTVRALSRVRDGRILATTPVVAKNLSSLGYRGPLFIPQTSNGIERGPVEAALREPSTAAYDAVYVGRYHPHKGFLDLPRTVARMKKALGRDVRVAVVGRPHFRRHMARFEALARAHGVQGDLILKENPDRAEMYRIVRASRMLLYPSYVDGFSLTVLESLCLGVPVVAYDIDALSMIWGARDGVYRSPVGDADGLGELAARVHRDREPDVEDVGMRRQSAALLDEYSWGRVAADEHRFYSEACEGRAG
jgi:glycosyltransferase involved in cell wall biosynthesis